jgi:hypothetical protein
MKKLISALALCIGTAAFANVAQDAQQQPKPSTAEQHDKGPGPGVDATKVGPAIGNEAKKLTGTDDEAKKNEELTFKKTGAFNIRGTVKSAKDSGITLERSGLPPAELAVKDQTKVRLDGKQVKADAIPEGAPVRAQFQINGDHLVAVEIMATTPKGTATGGSGTKSDATKAKEKTKATGEEMKNDANKAANETQDKMNQ